MTPTPFDLAPARALCEAATVPLSDRIAAVVGMWTGHCSIAGRKADLSMPPALAELLREVATLEQERGADRERLDWLAGRIVQLDYDDMDNRVVTLIHGGLNDRQYTDVGVGHNLRAAIDNARKAPARAATEGNT